MTSNVLIRFVVAISMLAGLVLGPAAFAAPMHEPMAAMAGMDMPGHMDCCPEKTPTSNCAKCQLMALCSTSLAEHNAIVRLPSMVARVVPRAALVDEPFHVGRHTVPLPEPPRSLV